MKNINIALLGCGTVAQGVINILKGSYVNEKILSETGLKLTVKKILVRNIPKYSDIVNPELLTDDINEILQDKTIDIVVELIGGKEPASDYMISCLKSGKNVVSANKLAIAQDGELFEKTADENHVRFMYEASVAGAIPIIRVIKNCLIPNNITEISGIINGTTNFILTKMSEESMNFEDALKLAQSLGIAEAEPSLDIDGFDAMYKLAILSKIAYRTDISLDDIEVAKLSTVTPEMIAQAKSENSVIKYIAHSKNENGRIILSVKPEKISSSHPLAFVKNENNAVYLNCDNAGELLFQGKGAGSLPTASAVLTDIINIGKTL